MELRPTCPHGGACGSTSCCSRWPRSPRRSRCRAGAFDPPTASVSAGEAVSLPSRLLLAPLIAWFGGMLLAVRILMAIASRLPVPAPPRFGPVVRGTLGRSLRRRSWALATGTIGVGLVVAFGIGLAHVQRHLRRREGSRLRGSSSAPTCASRRARSAPVPIRPASPSRLEVPGVSAVTPVVFKLENSVLIGPYDQDRKDLAAIDPASFERVAALVGLVLRRPHGRRCDGGARGRSAAACSWTRRRPTSSPSRPGDRVQVLLARGTKRQTLEAVPRRRPVRALPGIPAGHEPGREPRLLRGRDGPATAPTSSSRGPPTTATRASCVRSRRIRSGPGENDPINIESTETALDKDQSSLTAVNVHGLVDLDSLFTLLMSAAAIAIFVFGLMLQRRREYVTLRAQGMRDRGAAGAGRRGGGAGRGLRAGGGDAGRDRDGLPA